LRIHPHYDTLISLFAAQLSEVYFLWDTVYFRWLRKTVNQTVIVLLKCQNLCQTVTLQC